MKTAKIELPDGVFNKLVHEAEQRRQPLGDYVADLLARAIGNSTGPSATAHREPELPLIHSDQPGSVNITNEMIADQEAREDAERYGRFTGR
jgi:hypothetical protein